LKGKKALLAGASGLIGSELLQLLLQSESYEQVTAIVRRPLGLEHPKLKEIVCEFDRLEEIQEQLIADDVFCSLGTTIKKAKTREAMHRIDVDYPNSIAMLAKSQGARHFLVVSSMNANIHSPFAYSKMKAQLELNLQSVSYEALSIFRPSLLLGERSEFRFAENLAVKTAGVLSALFRRPISSRLAIEAKVVAQAMIQVANQDRTGMAIYTPNQIENAAK
jgi:uncharacterized protein YbjT (DUF2867 family)